jgi:hyperosmotically inducible protein
MRKESAMKKFFHWFLAGLLCMASAGTIWAQNGGSRMQDRISHEVYHELVMLPQLTIFDNLQYKADGGKITLMGQVRDATLKDSAEKVVKKIEGVESVNNQIEILPTSENDDRIRRQVARALFNDDRLLRYSMGSYRQSISS